MCAARELVFHLWQQFYRVSAKAAAHKKLTVKKHNFLFHGIEVTCVYLNIYFQFLFPFTSFVIICIISPTLAIRILQSIFPVFIFLHMLLISQKPRVSQGLNFLSRLLFLNQLWIFKEISAFLLCCTEHIATFCSPIFSTCQHELNIFFFIISFLRE